MGKTMRITLNGEPFDAPPDATIQDLLEALSLAGQRVALLMDDEIVRKAQFAETKVREDSQIEIVQMVGGG